MMRNREVEKTTRRLVVDEIKGDIVVIEDDDGTFEMPSKYLPRSAKAGDVFAMSIGIDYPSTVIRHTTIQRIKKDASK